MVDTEEAMHPRPDIYANPITEHTENNNFTCPHCEVLQAILVQTIKTGPLVLRLRKCRNCKDVTIDFRLVRRISPGADAAERVSMLYPAKKTRPATSFAFAPLEPLQAYLEACDLVPVHTGAAGAYARRCLEILLDTAGYPHKVLAESIKLVDAETDIDKRLPRALRLKLDYVREIGNFALHVRRDDELIIVDITAEEVEACLETIESLFLYWYDAPVEEYRRQVAMNEKLASAGRPAIPLPPLPEGITHNMALGIAEEASGADSEAVELNTSQ